MEWSRLRASPYPAIVRVLSQAPGQTDRLRGMWGGTSFGCSMLVNLRLVETLYYMCRCNSRDSVNRFHRSHLFDCLLHSRYKNHELRVPASTVRRHSKLGRFGIRDPSSR